MCRAVAAATAQVAEAQQALADGATELDMVLNIGRLRGGDLELRAHRVAVGVVAAGQQQALLDIVSGEAGIVVEFTDRARNRAWRAPEILDALDDFAERAGRRG